MSWPTTIFTKKLSFPLYSEDPLLNGMEVPSKLLPLGKISEQSLLLDFQMDEAIFATDLKWSIVFEETEKKIETFLHKIKKTADKGWFDDMNGIARAQQNTERDAPGGQKRQRYMYCSLRGLRLRYLHREVHEYLMQNPNATWNFFQQI